MSKVHLITDGVVFHSSGYTDLFDLIFGVLTPLSAIFQLYQWRPVLVVEEAGENHRTWASKW
jgi:hypothetical protein